MVYACRAWYTPRVEPAVGAASSVQCVHPTTGLLVRRSNVASGVEQLRAQEFEFTVSHFGIFGYVDWSLSGPIASATHTCAPRNWHQTLLPDARHQVSLRSKLKIGASSLPYLIGLSA